MTWHAKLTVNSGSQVVRQLFVSGPDQYVWSAILLLAKHYESTGLTTHLSRWKAREMPFMGHDRSVDMTLKPGDDLPW